MSRSSWKNYFFNSCKQTFIKTLPTYIIFSRDSTVLPFFVGKNVLIHSGQGFKSKTVKEEWVGYKFGEFVPTRGVAVYKGKKKR